MACGIEMQLLLDSVWYSSVGAAWWVGRAATSRAKTSSRAPLSLPLTRRPSPLHLAGDMGRTRPCLGDLLGCRAQIAYLDVTDIHMGDFLLEGAAAAAEGPL